MSPVTFSLPVKMVQGLYGFKPGSVLKESVKRISVRRLVGASRSSSQRGFPRQPGTTVAGCHKCPGTEPEVSGPEPKGSMGPF